MQYFTQILSVFILIAVAMQDFKSRSVYWFWFPFLVVLFIVDMKVVHGQQLTTIGQSAIINLSFIGAQLLLVSGYFSIKHKQWVNITKELLGWGDVLFLLSIAFYFSPLNYIFFYVGSLLVVVLIFIARLLIIKKKYDLIPLAGLQSIILMICLIISRLSHKMDLTSDYWLQHYLYL